MTTTGLSQIHQVSQRAFSDSEFLRHSLQNSADDVNDDVLAEDVGLDDPGVVLLRGDHVDVVLEHLGLQLLLGLRLEVGPAQGQTVSQTCQFSVDFR